jgi:selenocysteine-specific elongation factor
VASPGDSSTRSIHPVVVGTAGHIDHGKSTLVRALTGIDPDRLKEEKERGLTIDLGFAPIALEDGRLVGMIDVPGHERFVRNMVAGATGVDLALLVVAADDGVMPQTVEHLEVLDLLGVERGLVALTKIDQVDDETRELAVEEIVELLAGTKLEGSAIHPVSALRGTGVEEIKAALLRLAAETEPREGRGPFRMPIQRVFALEGIGTVVTGIPIRGAVAVGDEIEFQPSGKRSRVRSVQAYGGPVARAVAGHSTALSVPDVRRDELARGEVAIAPGAYPSGDAIDVELRVLRDSPEPLAHRMPVRFHVGTVERRGFVQLLEEGEVAPGQEVVARIRIEEPVCCAHGDPFLLRSMTPPRTIAGGRVLRLVEAPKRYRRAWVATELESLLAAGDDPAARVAEAVRRAGPSGVTPGELSSGLGLAIEQVGDLIAADESLHVHKRTGRVFARAVIERGRSSIEESVTKILARRSLAASVERSALRTSRDLPPALKDAVLDLMIDVGKVRSGLQGKLLFVDRLAPLSAEDRELLGRVLEACETAGCRPPTPDEAAQAAGLPAGSDRAESLIARALDEERCVRIGDHLWASSVLRRVLHAVRANCLAHDGTLDIPELRDRLDTSRKWLIPLLEHIDSMGLTVLRQGVRHLLERSAVAAMLEAEAREQAG